MGKLRNTGEPCPLDELPLNMELCQPCRFFRGASLVTGYKNWKITCNWPRDGSYIDQRQIPLAFTEGWEKEDSNGND